MQFKRREEPATIEEEREALRAQHAALEDLKRQLAERVAAVREREIELHHALAESGSVPPGVRAGPAPLPPPRQEADTGEDAPAAERRDRALLDRERAVTERETLLERRERELAARAEHGAAESPPPPEPDAARLAQIEARLEELREAEKLFLRTRAELAGRSEALTARERLVSQKERELDDRDDATGKPAGPELSEMEERLRRLEQQQPGEQTRPGEQTLGFSGGLKKLQQGTNRPQQGG